MLGLDFAHLHCHVGLIGWSVNVTNHTQRNGQIGAVHHGELLMQEVVLAVSVVDEHVVDSVLAIIEAHGLQSKSLLHETHVAVLAKEHLLAMHEVDGAVGAYCLVGDAVVDAVVENHAVLQDLNHRAALVASSLNHNLLVDIQLNVDAAGKESATSAKDQFGRNKWVFGCAIRRRLRDAATVAGGAELALGQAINLVVEQQQVQVYIATHLVDEVVATNG